MLVAEDDDESKCRLGIRLSVLAGFLPYQLHLRLVRNPVGRRHVEAPSLFHSNRKVRLNDLTSWSFSSPHASLRSWLEAVRQALAAIVERTFGTGSGCAM